MNCLNFKAKSVSGDWVPFRIEDAPVPISNETFVLMNKPGSPILQLGDIRRGDLEYNLYEGDVIEQDGDKWLVSYERGFYLINLDCVVKYFDFLKDFKILGVREDVGFNINISYRKNHLFKYKNSIFRINDIVGAVDGQLLINSNDTKIDPKDIYQECCLVINHQRVYFNDVIDNKTIIMVKGRLYFKNKETGETQPI